MAPAAVHPSDRPRNRDKLKRAVGLRVGRDDGSVAPPPSSSSVASPIDSPTTAVGSSGLATLKHAHFWDIVVPSRILTKGRNRKVSIEVHSSEGGPFNSSSDELQAPGVLPVTTLPNSERFIVRLMKPPRRKKNNGGKDSCGSEIHVSDDSDDDDNDASDESILGHSDDTVHDPLLSECKTSPIPGFDVDEAHGGGSNKVLDLNEWTTKNEIPLKNLNGPKRDGKTVWVNILKKSSRMQSREVIFETEDEATGFCSLIGFLKKMQLKRDEVALEAALESVQGISDEGSLKKRVDLLVEIVSCWDLPVSDFRTSDPYVVVRAGDWVIHQTDHISSTLDPIYTFRTNSLFLLSMPLKKLFELHDGITFEVKDYDKMGLHESIGAAIVPPKMLFECDGKRLEFKLQSLLGEKMYGKGNIAIRCRQATKQDKKVLNAIKSSDDLYAGCKDGLDIMTKKGSAGISLKSKVQKSTQKTKSGPYQGETMYRVMPGPDPKRTESTMWMTEQQIKEESIRVSQNWIDAGSGKLGLIYLEVIGCDDLPNFDSGALGDKTDAFVTAVYEDAVVQTDIITDCNSPRWLPWTQRAFIFRMMHSSSQIFLAVADFDSTAGVRHDLIGRVAIDVTAFSPGTEYFLSYNLIDRDDLQERKQQGKISVRIMILINDERQLLISNITRPPAVYVNVRKEEDFRIVRFACTGKKCQYGKKQIDAYVEELLTYKFVFTYLQEGLINVLLWRGHFPVSLRISKCSILEVNVPVNSIVAFVAGVCIVERTHLLPSVFFGMIGWTLTAVLAFRRSHPNPWMRCKPFWQYVRMLALDTPTQPQSISAGENEEESSAFIKEWESRIEESEEKARATREANARNLQQLQKELQDVSISGDVDISTNVGKNVSIDPLRALWVRVQDVLEIVVRCFRFLRSLLLWEEYYFAFLVCASSYLLAFLFLVVPWVEIVRWALRIVVWGLLGPWMKLIDRNWGKIKPVWKERIEGKREQNRKAIATFARVEKENAAKVKAFKKFLFGKYITKVPILKHGSKYRDTPLPESTAMPVTKSNLNIEEAAKNRKRIIGQQLAGDMVPVIETDGCGCN